MACASCAVLLVGRIGLNGTPAPAEASISLRAIRVASRGPSCSLSVGADLRNGRRGERKRATRAVHVNVSINCLTAKPNARSYSTDGAFRLIPTDVLRAIKHGKRRTTAGLAWSRILDISKSSLKIQSGSHSVWRNFWFLHTE